MTLPASFPLSMSQINVELGRASNATTSLLESAVRTLAQRPSGSVGFNNLLGKASLVATGHDDSRGYVSSGGAGNADSFPNVTVAGGVAPYTYSWSFTSNPDGTTLLNSTSATATVRKAFSVNASGDYTSILQCVVTDNVGTSRTVTNVSASASWEP